MKKCHDVEKVAFDGDVLLLKVDGKELSFALADVSSRLLAANPAERTRFEISPSGRIPEEEFRGHNTDFMRVKGEVWGASSAPGC